MGCVLGTVENHVNVYGQAYADGMDVGAVAGYLRDPRNWIPHLAEANGGTNAVCALQGPNTDVVSFTCTVHAVHRHNNFDGQQRQYHEPRQTYQTRSGTAQLKRVDVQRDRTVVEVLVDFSMSTNVSTLYTFTLQRASSTFSSQPGTTISTMVACRYGMPAFAASMMEQTSRKMFKQQTDALMMRLSSALSCPVVQQTRPVQGKPIHPRRTRGTKRI